MVENNDVNMHSYGVIGAPQLLHANVRLACVTVEAHICLGPFSCEHPRVFRGLRVAVLNRGPIIAFESFVEFGVAIASRPSGAQPVKEVGN